MPDPAAASTTVIEPRAGWRALDPPELFRYRDLLRFLVARDVMVVYKQSVLGFGWAILTPLLSMVIFTLVFGRLAKVPSDGVPYPLFSYAALVPWTYFSAAVSGATSSLVTQANVFTKVYFPRLFIPLTPVLAKLADFLIALVALGFLMAFYGRGPTASVWMLPALVLLMVVSAGGMGMWLSALAIQYRDVKFATNFLTQILMYAAPVVWPASLVPAPWRPLYAIYPMVGVIEGFRSALLGTRPMPWDLVAIGAASATIIALSGTLYFRRTERLFADVA